MSEKLTDEQLDQQASFTEREKIGLTNDLNFLANMLVEHGQYMFNLVAAVNVLTDIVLKHKLVTPEELTKMIDTESSRMKEEFIQSQQQQQQKAA